MNCPAPTPCRYCGDLLVFTGFTVHRTAVKDCADLRRFPALQSTGPGLYAGLPLLEGGATLVDYLERNLQAVFDRLGIACPMVRSSSLDIDPALRGQQHILAIARLLERLCSEDPESIRADVR